MATTTCLSALAASICRLMPPDSDACGISVIFVLPPFPILITSRWQTWKSCAPAVTKVPRVAMVSTICLAIVSLRSRRSIGERLFRPLLGMVARRSRIALVACAARSWMRPCHAIVLSSWVLTVTSIAYTSGVLGRLSASRCSHTLLVARPAAGRCPGPVSAWGKLVLIPHICPPSVSELAIF